MGIAWWLPSAGYLRSEPIAFLSMRRKQLSNVCCDERIVDERVRDCHMTAVFNDSALWRCRCGGDCMIEVFPITCGPSSENERKAAAQKCLPVRQHEDIHNCFAPQ